jgi:hypothetical protein
LFSRLAVASDEDDDDDDDDDDEEEEEEESEPLPLVARHRTDSLFSSRSRLRAVVVALTRLPPKTTSREKEQTFVSRPSPRSLSFLR